MKGEGNLMLSIRQYNSEVVKRNEKLRQAEVERKEREAELFERLFDETEKQNEQEEELRQVLVV